MSNLRYKNGKTFYADSIEIVYIDKESFNRALSASRCLGNAGLKLSDEELLKKR